MGVPIPESAAGDAHGDSGACGILAGLRGGGGDGAAAQLSIRRWKKPRSTWARPNSTAFRRVTLPYLDPAIAAAAMLAFTVSIDDYVITSLVAGVDSQTLPMVIYALARRGVNPMLNAVSTMIVVALGAMVLISERLRLGMNRRGFLLGAAGAAACYSRRAAAQCLQLVRLCRAGDDSRISSANPASAFATGRTKAIRRCWRR